MVGKQIACYHTILGRIRDGLITRPRRTPIDYLIVILASSRFSLPSIGGWSIVLIDSDNLQVACLIEMSTVFGFT